MSPHIRRYMASRLLLTPGCHVWEPCAGNGALVDALLELHPAVHIHATEIDPGALQVLRARYADSPNVQVSAADALLDDGLFDQAIYDRIIANPPYGAWQDGKRRSALRVKFADLYVKETYALFLWEAFTRLAPHGRLVFIMPDTVLWLNRHEKLRRRLVSQATIEEIALFPSRFFPGASFGYSGLCIVTIRKDPPLLDHETQIWTDLRGPEVLSELVARPPSTSGARGIRVDQTEILSTSGTSFAPYLSTSVVRGGVGRMLGDIANVVTGFYSGNDSRWLRRGLHNVRRAARYQPIDPALIASPAQYSIDGIMGERCYVPIVKGGAARFVKATEWYVDWSSAAVTEYRRSGRNPARFQNSRFYFCNGIGVPMVRSRVLTAALLEGRLFDQGIVGVFPYDAADTHFLLGFLNSELASRQMDAINPTANNSAAYVKRLIVPSLDATTRHDVEGVVRRALEDQRYRALDATRRLDVLFGDQQDVAVAAEAEALVAADG